MTAAIRCGSRWLSQNGVSSSAGIGGSQRSPARRWAVAALPEVHGMAEFVRKGCPELTLHPKD